MTGPLCGARKARRSCPALTRPICASCCGAKRLTEIACVPDCGYLAAAREHPAAVVRREQERDLAVLLPTIRHLTERQYQLFFLFHSVIVRHAPEGFARLLDADVADAAGALAATLETAARGVIYEHQPQTIPGARLAGALKTLLEQVRKEGAQVFDHEAAVTLRAIEAGAGGPAEGRTSDTAYLELMRRLLQAQPSTVAPPASSSGSSLILP